MLHNVKFSSLHMILREEMTQLQGKTSVFFRFWGHNVPIYCSKLLAITVALV